MAVLLKGKPVADALCEQLKERVAGLLASGVTPTLAIVRVGAREDDLAYERGAQKRCELLGLGLRKFLLPDDCSQEALIEAIETVNDDTSIHGCLLMRPLPGHLDEDAACRSLSPAKDVDGITEGSLYGVFAGQRMGFPPCTADACLKTLAHYGYELSGARVAVVGRSLVIGRPVSLMLQSADATVTMCHSRTRDLAAACREADILVVATGHIGTVGREAVRKGQIVIDVGINWDDAAQRLCGDVAFDEVEPVVDAITPVPGGIGSVTTAVLAAHVIEAAERTLGRG